MQLPYNVQTTRTRIQNTQFAEYIYDLPVTFKQSQSYQIYNDNVDHEQGNNYGKFESSCFNAVREKANVKVFSKRKYVNYLPWTCAKLKNSGIFMIYLM